MSKNKKKIILLGFDGFNPELIGKYSDRIPEIKSVLKDGFFSPALSSPYTDTPTNWTTISTGSWMGTHGITGFEAHLKGMELGKSVPTFNSELCNSEHFWEAAERQDKKSILINYPNVFPFKTKNTIIVGGDGLYSKKWTVRWADFITTTKDKEILHSDIDVIQQCTSVDFENDICWKNIPEKIEAIGESTIVFKSSESKFEWGAEGIRDASKDESDSKDIAQETRFVLIYKEEGDLKIAIAKQKDFNKVYVSVSKGQWSGWVDENFFGKECIRQYKLLRISEDGKSFEIYGTMAFSTKGWAFPEGLEKDLIKNCGPYIEALELSPDQGLTNNWFGYQTTCEILDMQANCLENFTVYLSKKIDWDIMFVQFHLPDGINHIFMGDLESKDDAVKKQADEFIFYSVKRIFEFVKKVKAECVDDNTVLAIVSDHGNLTKKYFVNARGMLINNGLEVFKKNTSTNLWDLDTNKSKAVFTSTGIWINLKGREKYGIVSPGKEYERLRDLIINDLRKMVNPKTQEPVFELVGKREAFEGMGMWGERIPDIVAFARPYYLFYGDNSEKLPDEKFNFYKRSDAVVPLNEAFKYNIIRPLTAVHWNLPNAKIGYASNRAIFMLSGPGIVKDKIIDRVNLVDVAPTLAAILGINPPADSEGRIIEEAFED